MFTRLCLLISLPLFLRADSISFQRPVQIPEAVLQPGTYTIKLEDHLADRAIVRITESGGADHYLLTVPSKKMKAAFQGLVFFKLPTGMNALRGWECDSCGRPLEFVYPKDEAVKLTADSGKPVLAYDPSYDKLPANLSSADRKVVTLWLLTPKTITPSGTGEGLTAAKYSAPKAMASAESLPKTMPKTATSAVFEMIAGVLSFLAGIVIFLWRKVSALPKLWKMAAITALGGMVMGFAMPIVASYTTTSFYLPPSGQTFLVPTLDDRDAEIANLKARNRRLEATVDALRHQ